MAKVELKPGVDIAGLDYDRDKFILYKRHGRAYIRARKRKDEDDAPVMPSFIEEISGGILLKTNL